MENDAFTLKDAEEKTGEVGENTDAKAKSYEGFIVQSFE